MKFYTVRSLGNAPRHEFQTLAEAREFISRKLTTRNKPGNPYRIYEHDGAEPTQPGIVRDFPGIEVPPSA